MAAEQVILVDADDREVGTMGKLAAIQMREKDEIREELGRSPDKGDSVAMNFVEGLPPPGARESAEAFRRRGRITDWRAR